MKRLQFLSAPRSKRVSAVRKRSWRWWVLALVAVLILPVLGLVGYAGYDYCNEEDDSLSDCAVNFMVNTYRTLWGGDSEVSSSDVTNPGTVSSGNFYSEALDRTMRYVIYLPPGYDDPHNSSTRYPVVYLLPGSSGGTKTWVSGGAMAQQMDGLLAQGKVQPMILVVPQERPDYNVHGTGYVDGPLGNWATYTTRDLVDQIDSNYRTVQSKDGRAIAGLSEGGYGAMNLGLKNSSEFGVIGSFSGYFAIDEHDLSSIFGGDQGLADANSPMTYLPQLEGELPAIYFYVGGDDGKFLAENQEFADELEARGASYEFNIFPGGSHNWDLWGAHLPDFLLFASAHLARGA